VRDDQGYLRIVDRVKDLIITGGMNVYPAEVERVLRQHAAVADICVVGAPDPDFGEAVTAFVVRTAGTEPDEAELIDYARAGLAGYKKPRRIVFVDEFPRGPTGKVSKAALRESLAGEGPAAVGEGGRA
jgi:acyl-CoA synthetase (AMP-forming)/AMP-acid ligase II